jgi:hypothetical protein
MYIGWQQRIFPYAPFDAFIEGLEKLGSSYVLKVRPIADLQSLHMLLPMRSALNGLSKQAENMKYAMHRVLSLQRQI